MSVPMVSTYFSWREATTTNTGISNFPDTELHRENILYTAKQMDRVRILLDNPCYINSWYRNTKVNSAVGGVPNSQHARGEAVDFRCPGYGTPYEVCLLIQDSAAWLPFDQLILEPTWIHISFTRHREPRRQVLTLAKGGGYVPGLQPQTK